MSPFRWTHVDVVRNIDHVHVTEVERGEIRKTVKKALTPAEEKCVWVTYTYG